MYAPFFHAMSDPDEARSFVRPVGTEHGRVVPTGNYSSVHLTGTVTAHDLRWVRGAVTRRTDHHESDCPDAWAVTDAPPAYVDKNLRTIVGIETLVERADAKAEPSQNRSDADRAGVVAGLRAVGGSAAVADATDRS